MGSQKKTKVLGLLLAAALAVGAAPVGLALADQAAAAEDALTQDAQVQDASDVQAQDAAQVDVAPGDQVDAVEGAAATSDVPASTDDDPADEATPEGADTPSKANEQGGGMATIAGSADLPLLASPSSDVPVGTSAGDLVGSRRVVSLKEEFSAVIDGEVVPVFSSGVSVVGGKDPSEDNTFEYLTGQSAKFGIVINNKDNTNERIVRVYFAYDGTGQLMGDFQPGKQYNLRNSDGTIYPMEVVETDVPNVFYYEKLF